MDLPRGMIDDEMDFCFVLKFWPSLCRFILVSFYTSGPCLSVCLSLSMGIIRPIMLCFSFHIELKRLE